MSHDLLSPSRAHRYVRCPGSVREESKYPPTPSGPSAIDGTHTHTLLETCLDNNVWDAKAYISKPLEDHEGVFIVEAQRAGRVNIVLDYIQSRIEHVKSLGLSVKVISEQKVNPEKFTGHPNMKGSADVQIQGYGEAGVLGYLEVIDLKDGMNPVDAEGNEQIDLYCLGAIAECPAGIEAYIPVRTTIIQPKLKTTKNLEAISFCDRTVEEVLATAELYKAAATAAQDPNAPLVPGEKQCRYCAHKGCSARAQLAMESAGVTFAPINNTQENPVSSDVATSDASHQLANQDPGAMSNEQLAQMLEAAPLMRKALEMAEEEALRRLEAGVAIPGLKLVNGRGSKVWNLSDDEMVEKLRGMGVPKDAVYVTKVVSPAQVKKLTWTKRDGSQKQLTERQLKTIEKEYISTIAGKLTVAHESDPRPAVVRDASPMFAAVEQQSSQPVETAVPDWLQTPAWLLPQS